MKMKTACLSLFILAQSIYAQSAQKPPKPKKVTITGCVYSGVECVTLKDSKGKQDYSIAANDRLTVGQAYKITGTVSEIGFCQAGKPILAPTKISSSKLKCEIEAPAK